MKQVIDDVCKLLQEQKKVQEALYDLALRKREAVIKNKTDDLTNIVSEEYIVLSQMNKIEKQRITASSGASEQIGKAPKDITVSDLLEYADRQQKPILATLQKELLDIMTKLKAQNIENKSLVELQLEFTGVMLSAIAGTEDPLNNFYGGDGQSLDAQISRGRNILDTEI